MRLSNREKKLINLLVLVLSLTLSFVLIIAPALATFTVSYDSYKMNKLMLEEMEAIVENASTQETNYNNIKTVVEKEQKNVYARMSNYEFQEIVINDLAKYSLTLEAMEIVIPETPSLVNAIIEIKGSFENFKAYINETNTTSTVLYITQFTQELDSEIYKITLEFAEVNRVE